MERQHQIFFDFIRFSIGSDSEIPSSLKEADWKELYRIALKQCLVGILFDGIQKLPPAEVGINKDLLLQWMMQCQMLKKAIVRLNDAAAKLGYNLQWVYRDMRLVRYFPAELAYLYQGAQGCWYMVVSHRYHRFGYLFDL